MKFGIIIPALNEEDNIVSIVTMLPITRRIVYLPGLVRDRVQYWQQLRKC